MLAHNTAATMIAKELMVTTFRFISSTRIYRKIRLGIGL